MGWTLAIETGIEPEYETALQLEALDQGWKVKNVQNIPFTNQFITGSPNMGTPLSNKLLQNPKVWFHGSIQAAKRAQKATSWQVHAPWEDLRCRIYYSKLSKYILQSQHKITTLQKFKEQRSEFFTSSLVKNKSLFVRPDSNDKVFTGGCITLDTFENDYKLITFYDPSPETSIVVAVPQQIFTEARFLVVDGEIITGSYYQIDGSSVCLEASPKLLALADEFLSYCLDSGFNPEISWALDLAETLDGWKIIEVGATSCCGLYKCNLNHFMSALDKVLNV